MKKTFKYRLYPNRECERKLEQTLNTCRILYNNALAERKESWESEKKGVSCYDQINGLVANKEDNEYLQCVHSQVLQDALRRADKSFRNFFRRVKTGDKPGYPRFRGYWRYDSFTYPQSGFKVDGKKLNLSKIGLVNIKLHRQIEGVVKTCTIKRDIDRWYACFSVEMDREQVRKVEVKTATGIDVGLKSIVTLSNGQSIEPPKHYRQSEDRLAQGQRCLSRKKKGSRNRSKQRFRVAKIHRKVRKQRRDFNHKLARELVDSYDLIAFENLNVKGLVRNKHLSKSISDASWSQLQAFTSYKAEEAGKHVEFVDPKNTTKECSMCGTIHEMPLHRRILKCDCGLVMDRDRNAAINILKRVGQELPDSMPARGFPLGTPVTQEATTSNEV